MSEPDDTTPYDYEKQPFTTLPGAMVIPGAPWQTQFQEDADRFATRWNTFDVDSDNKRLRLQRLEKIGPDAILTSPNASRLCDNVSDALWLGWDPEYVADFLKRWCIANEVRAEKGPEGTYPQVYINGVLDSKFFDGARARYEEAVRTWQPIGEPS